MPAAVVIPSPMAYIKVIATRRSNLTCYNSRKLVRQHQQQEPFHDHYTSQPLLAGETLKN